MARLLLPHVGLAGRVSDRYPGSRCSLAPGTAHGPVALRDSTNNNGRMSQTPPDGLPRYRMLTGPDDATFCARVSEALDLGYQLAGAPALSFDGERAVAAQAVLWLHEIVEGGRANLRSTLDLLYEKQLEVLQSVRRSVADVATARKRLELQVTQLEKATEKWAGEAEGAAARRDGGLDRGSKRHVDARVVRGGRAEEAGGDARCGGFEPRGIRRPESEAALPIVITYESDCPYRRRQRRR